MEQVAVTGLRAGPRSKRRFVWVGNNSGVCPSPSVWRKGFVFEEELEQQWLRDGFAQGGGRGALSSWPTSREVTGCDNLNQWLAVELYVWRGHCPAHGYKHACLSCLDSRVVLWGMLFTTKTCCRRCISCFGCYWCCSCLAQCDTRQTNALFSLDQLENNVLYTVRVGFRMGQVSMWVNLVLVWVISVVLLPVYTPGHMLMCNWRREQSPLYEKDTVHDAPFHVFALRQNALRCVQNAEEDHAMILLGSIGAGSGRRRNWLCSIFIRDRRHCFFSNRLESDSGVLYPAHWPADSASVFDCGNF